ncbi:titin-like [Armigeres subalbatus]|uniref:titin-like n=1 Tax=Armigeres subalbatus TaxID=124917 RepID=UPI002ED041CD
MERFAINILHKRIYKICRLCGVDQPHKIPIIEGAETIIVGDEDEEASLAKKIEECVGIQVHKDDKMPQNICALCVDKINDFYEYRLMCAATNLQTRSILNLNLVEPSRKLLNFGEISKVEDDKKEDVKKVVEVATSSSSSIIPSPGKKGKKKRGPPSPSPSPAPTTRIKAAVDVKDEPVPVVPVKALTKKERMKQMQLQKEKEEQKKKEEEIKKKEDGRKRKEDEKKKDDEKKKKEDLKRDRKDDKLKKEKVEVKQPEVNEQKHTRSKRKEPSPVKETSEKAEPTVPPPKKIKFEHPCSYCSDEFKTQSELDGHLGAKHTALIRKFGCASCRETFETVLESKDHNLWHQLTRTPYTCFKCKRKYDKNLALVKHMTLNACGRVARGRPPTILPDVQCRLCNKKFKTQNLYEWHSCFLKPKSNCPKCGKYFVKKQILSRHYMMFCTGTLPTPEPVIIPKAEPIDPADKPAASTAVATIAERRKRRVAFAEPELPKEEREIPFPPQLEPEASIPSPAPTPTPSGGKKKTRKDSTPTVTIKPVPPPPAAAEKITSLLNSGAKLDRDSDIATINNLLSSVTEAIASISEAKAKKKKKKKDKNKDKAEAENEASAPAPAPVVEEPKKSTPEVVKKPLPPQPPPAPEPPAAEPKSAEELEAYALAQEVGEMTLDQQLAFCSGKLPLVVLNKTSFKQECTEIDMEPSQLQEPMEEETEPDHQVTVENGEEEDNGYDDEAANDYSDFQNDDDHNNDDEPQQASAEEEHTETEENQQTEEVQFPMPIKQEIESEEPTIAPETPEQEEPATPEQEESIIPEQEESITPEQEAETQLSSVNEAPLLEKEARPPSVQARAKTPKDQESLFDSQLAINIKKEPGLEEDQQPALKRKRPESRTSAVGSPASLSSTQSPTQDSPKLILKIRKNVVEPAKKAIKTIVLDDDDDDEEEQSAPDNQPTKKQKIYKKPDFLAVKIKQEKVDPTYERPEPTIVNQVELPGGIRIKQERPDPDEEPAHVEENSAPTPPPQKKSRLSRKDKPASPVIAFDGVRIKQEKPDVTKSIAEAPPPEDPKPQEKKKKSKGKINPFALLRQKLAAEAAAKQAEESAAPPQAPSPLPVITNVVGNAPTPAMSSSSSSSSGATTPMVESDTESERRVPVIAQVASIASAKVSEPEFPVPIKQEPVDEPDEEEEQDEHNPSEAESTNQETDDGFPIPIKQEPPEEQSAGEGLSTPEEPSSPDEPEEPELPRPIKEEPKESQPEHAESADASEEEPEQSQDEPAANDTEEEHEKQVVPSATSDSKIEDDDQEDKPETEQQNNEVEENKDLDDEEEDDETDEVHQSSQNEEVEPSADTEEQEKEARNDDDDEEEEESLSAVEAKEDVLASKEQKIEQTIDENNEQEEEEQVQHNTDDEKVDSSQATEGGVENTEHQEKDDDGGDEDHKEQEDVPSLTIEGTKNEEADENDNDEEGESSSSPVDKTNLPAPNEDQEKEDSEDGNELEENVPAVAQHIEKKLDDQNQLNEIDEMENSTSPISDIPMDDYDQNSKGQEEQEPLEENKSPPVADSPQESETNRLAIQPNNERHDRPTEAHRESSSIAESSEALSVPPEPSSTSDGCSDTRLESQLEELQNLLTVGLQQPLPDSSQFPQTSSLATASNNDQSMVQSSSIGSSVGNNVGVSGLDDDLDSLLNNKLEEITAAQPLSAGPPQDDINMAIERELLHEIMPIGSEISATSGHSAGTGGLLEVGQDILQEGAGNSAQQ